MAVADAFSQNVNVVFAIFQGLISVVITEVGTACAAHFCVVAVPTNIMATGISSEMWAKDHTQIL